MDRSHLFDNTSFADEYDEYEETSENIYTSNNPEEDFCRGETINIYEIVDTFKDPQNSHHHKQLGVQNQLVLGVLVNSVVSFVFATSHE